MPKFRDIKIRESIGEFNRKVKMNMVGMDGNAFNLMAQFEKRAKSDKWTSEEIQYVLHQCMSGDYDHLLSVLLRYTEEDEENPEIIYHNGKAYRVIE
jgi:hypothetical protein